MTCASRWRPLTALCSVFAEADPIVPLENAFYTKSLLPEAELRTFEGLGHLSIWPRTMEAAGDLAAQVSGGR